MSATAPAWALTIAYWLHMLATVVWIGGLAALSLIIYPAARRTMTGPAFGTFLGQVQARLQSIGWFSLAVLVVTGMFQMSSSPFYKGFLAIENTWAIVILAKHAAIGVMVLLSGYLTWGLTPALQRMVLLQNAGKQVDPARHTRLQNQVERLLRLNLGISVIVLALTAIARSV